MTTVQVGSQTTNGSYAEFRARVTAARVEVEVTYDNSLGECLVDNGCLDNILDFLGCMLVGRIPSINL